MESGTYSGKGIKNRRRGSLSSYSLAGIGIGGVIGAGFLLGSGLAISQAGPSVIIAFLFGGLIMSQVLGAMTNISINRPVRGSFRVYTEELLGSYAGFLLGWVVFTAGVLALGSEAVAAGVFLKYWFPQVPVAVFALAILLLVVGVNALGTKDFGYIESGMAAAKIGIIIVFIILGGIFLFKNGINISPRSFMSINAFFPNGASGFLQSMLIVIFTYSGISAVAMAVSEVRNPHRDIPKATEIMTAGIISLYILSMTIIVFIVRWDTVNTNMSPFVQSFNNMGLGFMSAVMNGIILIAAISVMFATYYGCMQIMSSLSEAREAPDFLKNIDRNGFPRNTWMTVAVSSFVVVALSVVLGSRLFNYLISASSYFTFFNWSINLITYIVWLRKRSKDEHFGSSLIWGRAGAYGTLFIIAVLFIMSLRVADFRTGFFAAAAILIIISVSYMTHRHKRKIV